MSGAPGRDRLWTVPNLISGIRILGLIPLAWSAYEGHRTLFLGILLLLLFSDWIDGKLAVALGQKSDLGSRLDSVADWLMYAALGISVWIVYSDPLGAGIFRTGFCTLAALFVIVLHHGNIRRLLRGTEHKIGSGGEDTKEGS